ncbi:MAG: rod shape-determining protein MreC [Solirubrobacterales bacterium]
MYRKQVRRRRAVLVGLIVVCLVLLSISFSEAESGPLHSIQRGVSAVLSPVEEGASRALKPARDFVNWFGETFDARGDNDALREEVQDLRVEVADAQSAVGENEQFRKMLDLAEADAALGSYKRVTGRVIGRSPTVWYSTVTIDVGTSLGVEVNDAVVTGDGLVGRISEATRGSAQVALLTDHRSAVSASVLPEGPDGIVEPEVGDPDDLLLDFIDNNEDVKEGQILVTAGWSDGQISSAYPYGIEIGRVTEATVGEQETFQQVHVQPFADIRGLDYVQVLTGGPARPGVPG